MFIAELHADELEHVVDCAQFTRQTPAKNANFSFGSNGRGSVVVRHCTRCSCAHTHTPTALASKFTFRDANEKYGLSIDAAKR